MVSLNRTNIQFCSNKPFTWTSDNPTTLGIPFYNDINKTLKFNTDKTINEFKIVIKQWVHRKLTLMGNVTVIKTFDIPKLIDPFTIFETRI